MKFCFLLIFSVFSSYLSAQKESEIDAIIKREMNERKIPGLQISVVQNGKIILKKSYGMASVQNNIPVTDATIFPINSCTKVFTGVAVMQLVEEGEIELSAPISKYLADLPEKWQPVTVEQMMTHISGFPDIVRLFDPLTGAALKPEKQIWEELKALPMDFKTGEQFRYNQTNYYLLGKIIEKVSGEPFDLFFKTKQFQTVGMKNTVFGDSRDVISNFAPTYSSRSFIDGKKLDKEKLFNDYHVFPDYTRTGSGLNTSAEDMAKWIISLQKQELFKNKRTLTKMWSPIKMNDRTSTSWALGWGITKFRAKHNAVGMSGGGRSAFLVYPDDNLSVIVFTNMMGSTPEDFLEELAGVYNPDIVKSDAITYLRLNLRKQGFNKAIDVVKSEKKNNPDFQPGESELNDWGYRLMSRSNQLNDAYEIFKLYVYLYPDSANAYDSYGEVLLKMGNKNEARKMYEKSVKLNPDNENGKNVLKQLNE